MNGENGEIEDFVDDLDADDERSALLVVLEFLRRHKKRKARTLASLVTVCMTKKWLAEGRRRSDIAERLGITERRVYQIQKNMN